MTAAFSVAAPSMARSTGRGASASTQSHKPPSVRSAESSDADAGRQRVERRVPAGAGLHHRLDLGAVLVVVAERRERHRRLARVAVAQDQEAGGRHALGQDLAAEDRRGLGLQQGVQRLQDGFAGGGHVSLLVLQTGPAQPSMLLHSHFCRSHAPSSDGLMSPASSVPLSWYVARRQCAAAIDPRQSGTLHPFSASHMGLASLGRRHHGGQHQA